MAESRPMSGVKLSNFETSIAGRAAAFGSDNTSGRSSKNDVSKISPGMNLAGKLSGVDLKSL